MRKKTKRKSILALVAIATLLVSMVSVGYAATEDESSSINRFNVVVVLDASNSMNYTDPNGLRYEAIAQFTNLLAEKGNYLGGVVFSNHVAARQNPQLVQDQEAKDSVTNILESVMSHGVTEDMGYTNIGEALSVAVEMLVTSGSRELPSAILFLSDGNTEMPTEEELNTSLDMKADAIQRARENSINIYSVCLNANSKADTSEMEQISQATGGVFQEVANAEDLQDVFNTFYSMIYGTATIALVNDVFPTNGILETEFEVPGLGVEEVNIVINGVTKSITLIDPNGSNIDATTISSETFTLVKLVDLLAGEWKLVTEGVPGDQIKINMIYNTNLGIDVVIEPSKQTISTEDLLTVYATLKSGTRAAASDDDYLGYNAELRIKDAYGEWIDTVSMSVKDGKFVVNCDLDEGTYFVNVRVEGHYLEKASSDIGPVVVTAEDIEDTVFPNTAPTPVDNPVKKTVYIWPFKGGNMTIDLTALAIDEQDEELHYKVVSSSFIEGIDYEVDSNNVLTLDHFSLSKGSFDIKATDTGGLSCNVEVIVTSYNVGVMTLIVMGIVGLIVITILVILFIIAMKKPFRGTITVHSYCNGIFKGTPRDPKRGRCKLSVFGLDPMGLDYQKSYFQATGDRYVYLITNIPVMWNGQKTNKIRVDSGANVTLTIREGDSRQLEVRFDSRMSGRRMSGTVRGGRRCLQPRRR